MSHEKRDDFGAAEVSSETVPKTSGTGHGNDEATHENPNDFTPSPSLSLNPLEIVSQSHSSLSLVSEWDRNACPTVSPRARDAEAEGSNDAVRL